MISLDGVPVSIGTVGPWALFLLLVVIIVRAYMRGDIVPRRIHDDVIHDRDEWRAAHRISEAARQEERDQKKELLEHSRISAAFMAALPKPHQDEEV